MYFCCFQAEGNQNRLQEEVSRMLYQLEEERKVTENLSKGLELEKRKVESLEQRAKHSGSSRGSRESESGRRRSSLVPDCVKDAEDRLVQSMEIYRQRCDNLGTSLHSLRDKIEDERFFGDLATEVNTSLAVVSVTVSLFEGQQAEEAPVGREEEGGRGEDPAGGGSHLV